MVSNDLICPYCKAPLEAKQRGLCRCPTCEAILSIEDGTVVRVMKR